MDTKQPVWIHPDILPRFGYTLVVSEEQYLEICDELKIEYYNRGRWLDLGCRASVWTFENHDHGTCCVVCLDPLAHAGEEQAELRMAGTLVHEAVHVYQSLCNYAGEAHMSKEMEAYTIGLISENLFKAYLALTT